MIKKSQNYPFSPLWDVGMRSFNARAILYKLSTSPAIIMSLKRKATAAAVPSPEPKSRQPKGGKNATGKRKVVEEDDDEEVEDKPSAKKAAAGKRASGAGEEKSKPAKESSRRVSSSGSVTGGSAVKGKKGFAKKVVVEEEEDDEEEEEEQPVYVLFLPQRIDFGIAIMLSLLCFFPCMFSLYLCLVIDQNRPRNLLVLPWEKNRTLPQVTF